MKRLKVETSENSPIWRRKKVFVSSRQCSISQIKRWQNCINYRILEIWPSTTFSCSQTSKRWSLDRNFGPKLKPILRLKTIRTVKTVSKKIMTAVIVISPSKAIILNNKIKNSFYTSQRTLQLNLNLFDLSLERRLCPAISRWLDTRFGIGFVLNCLSLCGAVVNPPLICISYLSCIVEGYVQKMYYSG